MHEATAATGVHRLGRFGVRNDNIVLERWLAVRNNVSFFCFTQSTRTAARCIHVA